MLTIGDRRGNFPGMLESRAFRAVIVRDEHGIAPSTHPDATIEYQGKATSVRVQQVVNQ